MKIWRAVCVLIVLLSVTRVEAVPLPLDGSWTVLVETMTAPAFFTGPYEFTSSFPVLFTITDLYVVSDQFELYDSGSLVLTTPSLPDWDVLGYSGAFESPPWTDDPDVALASGFFSGAQILFAAGFHSLTIRDIHIPTGCNEMAPTNTCPDGTVAFRAEAVPEPASLLLLGTGLAGLALRRRKHLPA